MSLTPTPLYCSEWGCQQIEAHKSYTVKAGGVRRLYYCPECKGYFSETHNTPLANLKTPLSRIVEIVQALNEGLGVNAVCRVFGLLTRAGIDKKVTRISLGTPTRQGFWGRGRSWWTSSPVRACKPGDHADLYARE